MSKRTRTNSRGILLRGILSCQTTQLLQIEPVCSFVCVHAWKIVGVRRCQPTLFVNSFASIQMLIAKYNGHFRSGIAFRKERGRHLYKSCMYVILCMYVHTGRALETGGCWAAKTPQDLCSVEGFDFFDKSFCQQQYKTSQIRQGKG